MSPNLENQMPESSEIETNNENIQFTVTPLSDLSSSTSYSDGNQSIGSESNEEELVDDLVDTVVTTALRSYVPLEHNIRELLVRVSNTERLETVTQIKLRVIAQELALQQLGIYLPALRELTLDGSIIFSFRDLGYGLRNLKILRVNSCQLPCIDGVLGFESLEELYAADNTIKDLSSCAFLSNLRILDVRRNLIKSFGSLSFLNLCPDITHIFLSGNEAIETFSRYRFIVGRMIPQLEMLDGEPLLRGLNDCEKDDITVEDLEEQGDESEEIRHLETPERMVFTTSRLGTFSRTNTRNIDDTNGFTVRFPPMVCGSNENTKKK